MAAVELDMSSSALSRLARVEPHTFTVITTYGCTAACEQCCFKCTPHVTARLSCETILAGINEAYDAFPALELVVFTGGEAFMLGDDLDECIAESSDLGLKTRVVSNGYWGWTPAAASKRVMRLVAAGLNELNFSTGDEHQKWVPWERVRNAAIAAVERNIRTVITVESSSQAAFTYRDAMADPVLKEFMDQDPSSALLTVSGHIWISFTDGVTIPQASEKIDEHSGCTSGCGNVLENVVLTPNGMVAACCGLTFEDIPEMTLGRFGERPLREMFEAQFDDFLKSWVHVEGPQAILDYAHEKNPEVPSARQLKVVHKCEACAYIHQSPAVRATLQDHYVEKVPSVLLRQRLKVAWGDKIQSNRLAK
jgi:organic radical activating enzyme